MKTLLQILMVLSIFLLASLIIEPNIISAIIFAAIVLLSVFASKIVKIKKPMFRPFSRLNKTLSHQQPAVE